MGLVQRAATRTDSESRNRDRIHNAATDRSPALEPASKTGLNLGRHRHRRIAAQPRRDPAPRQPAQQRRRPAPARTQHGFGVAEHTAAVPAVRSGPAQRLTGARTLARDHLPQRAGLGQAADTATVARRALRGLGGCFGMDVDDLVHVCSAFAQSVAQPGASRTSSRLCEQASGRPKSGLPRRPPPARGNGSGWQARTNTGSRYRPRPRTPVAGIMPA